MPDLTEACVVTALIHVIQVVSATWIGYAASAKLQSSAPVLFAVSIPAAVASLRTSQLMQGLPMRTAMLGWKSSVARMGSIPVVAMSSSRLAHTPRSSVRSNPCMRIRPVAVAVTPPVVVFVLMFVPGPLPMGTVVVLVRSRSIAVMREGTSG